MLKVGILGTGNIASKMAETVRCMPDVSLAAVASRNEEKAKAFAGRFGCEKAYGTYEELAKDPEVQLAYIATPHSEHCANSLLCLENGKHVLCEKAFAANEVQADQMLSKAEERGLLLTEAMWVRYMPMAQTLRNVLDSGIIGKPMVATANLCYLIDQVPRILSPGLAGGALLDVGVYTLNFASLVFGDDIKEVHSSVIKTDTGVDAQNSITLIYPGGEMAVLQSSIHVISDRKGIVSGTNGFLIVENINNFESISVFDTKRNLIETHSCPPQITGFEYQVEACRTAIENGWTECPQMPHKTTRNIMRLMDRLRKQWGIVYPFEERER